MSGMHRIASSTENRYMNERGPRSRCVLVRILKHKSPIFRNSCFQGNSSTFGQCQQIDQIKQLERSISSVLFELKSCSKARDLLKAKTLHSSIIDSGNDRNIFVANALVDAYSKCGSMVDARRVFEEMPLRSVITWNLLVMGYVENGDPDMALEFFSRMQGREAVSLRSEPNARSFVAAAKACAVLASRETGSLVDGKLVKAGSMQRGVVIHSKASQYGFDTQSFVGCTLISMYMRCGSTVEAHRVFDRIVDRDKICWNALILGYVENGDPAFSLDLFARMQDEEEEEAADCFTFVAALKACAAAAAKEGKKHHSSLRFKCAEIHSRAEKCGCDSDLYVASTLVFAYIKCGSLIDAERVFHRMPQRNAVACTSLMLGYSENGQEEKALDLFSCIDCETGSPTLVAAFKACTSLAEAEEGRQIAGKIIKLGALERGMEAHSRVANIIIDHRNCSNDADRYAANALINMYAKCGSMMDSRRVFDSMASTDAVSLASLLLGYVESGEGFIALELFLRDPLHQQQAEASTLAAGIKACASCTTSSEVGREVHAYVYRNGAENDALVAISLLDLHSKSGRMSFSQHLFDSFPGRKELALWNALIGGYSRSGKSCEVFSLFQSLQDEGLFPDAVTSICVLTACSHAGLVEKARKIFEAMLDPAAQHYICMVDVLGRANQLDESVRMVKVAVEGGVMKKDGAAAAVAWRTVLAACVKWKNSVVARLAFEFLLEIDGDDLSIHLFMNKFRPVSGEDSADI